MADLPQDIGNIKARAKDCTAKPISNPAKLLRGYMKATGIVCARTLARDLEIPLRTIQRLKLEVATSSEDAIYGAQDEAPKTPNAPYMAQGSERTDANDAIYGASDAPNAPCVASRARVEDNNLTTNLETKVSTNPPPYSPPPSPPLDWRTAFADADLQAGVEVRNGEAVLVNGTHAAWLARFGGDATRLDLAMIEARAALQPNSRQPIKLQIERVLARIAGQKRDSDQRYASAAKHRQGSQGLADVLPFRVSPDTVRYARPAEEAV